MQFIHSDLGQRSKGEIVEFTLTRGANVRLLSDSDFLNYKNRRKYQYVGGLAEKSPVRLAIPNSGRWHAVVDTQGLSNSTEASIRVI